MPHPRYLLVGLLCAARAVSLPVYAVEPNATEGADLASIIRQNEILAAQVQQQQREINELRHRLDQLQPAPMPAAQPLPATTPPPVTAVTPRISPTLQAAKAIRISGEVGVGYFDTGKDGAFPESEFRLDEARLFLEAPVWRNVYFYTGLEIATREAQDNALHLGELYADIEEVWVGARDRRLSLRVGRFNIPFGEEYQTRNVMDNALITHSVDDIWGIDEGVQAYGQFGAVTYNLAVQNGGADTRRDYNRDKSVTLRLSIAPKPSLRFSVSGHRTGKLDAAKDVSSEIWFGGEYLGPLGPIASTRTFNAELLEFDATWQWRSGHVNGHAGVMKIDDDRVGADDARTARYSSIELVQSLTPKLNGALRFGEIRVPDGYPLVGLGNYGKFYYASPPTEWLRRLSLGLGYRFADPLVWKVEYSWESGRLITGVPRNHEDLFATELGLKF